MAFVVRRGEKKHATHPKFLVCTEEKQWIVNTKVTTKEAACFSKSTAPLGLFVCCLRTIDTSWRVVLQLAICLLIN